MLTQKTIKGWLPGVNAVFRYHLPLLPVQYPDVHLATAKTFPQLRKQIIKDTGCRLKGIPDDSCMEYIHGRLGGAILIRMNQLPPKTDFDAFIHFYWHELGHFYSIGEKFIYVFHMPLFFIISGFLSKKENDVQLFWKKIWYNLVVPMLMIATLNFIIHCILLLITGDFSPIEIYWFIRNIIFGMVSGFDNLWFVYTLIILKIIFQYCSSSKLFYFQSLIMLVFAYIYNIKLHLWLASGLPFWLYSFWGCQNDRIPIGILMTTRAKSSRACQRYLKIGGL